MDDVDSQLPYQKAANCRIKNQPTVVSKTSQLSCQIFVEIIDFQRGMYYFVANFTFKNMSEYLKRIADQMPEDGVLVVPVGCLKD